jgi:asparagine synthase (glutamine-hydrolysing)
MCGICGVISGSPNNSIGAGIDAMTEMLVHRGPDSSGRYVSATSGLGMRRLSIIDLATGDQPIGNEDGRYLAVQNGEIYNYIELRNQLQDRGHSFATASDTEVIAHGFEEWGTLLPARLQGMFALAVLDTQTDEIFLARDRFGEKPLFYATVEGELVFSSEISSLLEWSNIQRRLDHDSLFEYLMFGNRLSGQTMFRDVSELKPGTWLTFKNGTVKQGRYFELEYDEDQPRISDRDAFDAVRATFGEAVRRQLTADVEVGALLSGGVDSSAVVAYAAQHASKPIKTFTAKFTDANYDESGIAREVATRFGTDHHEIEIADSAFSVGDSESIVRHVGEPFADSSAIPTYLISKYASEHVKVCLTGDGGDEAFAGYDPFRWGRKIEKLAGLPKPVLGIGSAMAGVASALPGISRSSSLRQLSRGIAAARHSDTVDGRFDAAHWLFLPGELNRLRPDFSVRTGATDEIRSDKPLSVLKMHMRRRIDRELTTNMLIKTDRMSMATSLELRSPMLDHDLMKLSTSLPDNLLIRGGVGKWVLREAMANELPESVLTGAKHGFDIPLFRYMNAEFADSCHELLGDRTGIAQLFEASALQDVIKDGLNRREDSASISVYRATHRLWALHQLALWSKTFSVSI